MGMMGVVVGLQQKLRAALERKCGDSAEANAIPLFENIIVKSNTAVSRFEQESSLRSKSSNSWQAFTAIPRFSKPSREFSHNCCPTQLR